MWTFEPDAENDDGDGDDDDDDDDDDDSLDGEDGHGGDNNDNDDNDDDGGHFFFPPDFDQTIRTKSKSKNWRRFANIFSAFDANLTLIDYEGKFKLANCNL